MNMDLGENVTLQTEENGEENHFNYEEESDYCHSESSYHSIHNSDDKEYISSDEDGGANLELEAEVYSYDKDKSVMEVGAQYPNVTTFRRSLNHYALTTDFKFSVEKSDPTRLTARCAKKDCSWRIHASVVDDDVTFMVKTLQPKHSCSGVNKSGNKHATKGWIAYRIISDLRSEGIFQLNF
jgi:MuDR family transposase